MAYYRKVVKRYEPEASRYKGECDHLEGVIVGPPGISGGIVWAVERFVALQGGRMLKLTLDQDTDPALDKYRLNVWAHGSPGLPFVLLATFGIFVTLAVIVWRIQPEQWGKIAEEARKAAEAGAKGMKSLGWIALVLGGVYAISKLKD